MSPLVPATQTGLPQPSYTLAEVNRELARWADNLAKARASEDILGVDTALRYLDVWLDRLNGLRSA